MTCSLDSCDEKIVAKGMCKVHYSRQRRGAPLDAPVRKRTREGRHTTGEGYVKIKVEGHPASHRGWVYEHRVVMEGVLGRYLLPGENVHHINGDRADNRPENLELWVTAQPAGQRPQDLVAFAWYILATYGDDTQQ